MTENQSCRHHVDQMDVRYKLAATKQEHTTAMHFPHNSVDFSWTIAQAGMGSLSIQLQPGWCDLRDGDGSVSCQNISVVVSRRGLLLLPAQSTDYSSNMKATCQQARAGPVDLSHEEGPNCPLLVLSLWFMETYKTQVDTQWQFSNLCFQSR